ncbi:hypothetical protein Agub_g5132 [Astrephomene gubernaculifera]|uniref:Uncharacterized protein n=1 Tax=Astrephomene gubernaculifera TaxID=47775 RepID=A0AAD3HKC1_9CHLO|nr:hypothetical protein Agub_g5132 [Astrephomene gubernaculifera]
MPTHGSPVRRKRDWVDPELLDEGEGEAEEVSQEALLMQEELEGQQGAGQEGQQQQRRQGRRERGVQQYLELNLEADGTTEVVEFDEQGRVKARRQPGMPVLEDDIEAEDDEEDDDPLAFLADLEGDDDEDDDEEDEEPSEDADEVEEEEEEGDSSGRRSAAAGPSGRGASSSPFPSSSASQKRSLVGRNAGSRRGAEEEEEEEDGGEGLVLMPGVNPLLDEEIEWGLDELGPTGQQRPSLLRELGVIKGRPSDKQQQQQKRSQAASSSSSSQQQQQAGKQQQQKQAPADGVTDEDEEQGGGGAAGQVGVAWGGSGGASGIDMEQQEALLSRLFKPHKVKELMAHQLAAEAELAALKRRTSGRAGQEARLHTRMRLIGGSAAGKQLVSSAGANTRPMMEKVRHALFNMIQAQAGSGAGLPTTARWLDCFAGTGSVGLEALSRGVRECHFIEMDPWVCRKVLSRNISTCGFTRRSVVHTMKAEDFLRRAIELPKFAGGGDEEGLTRKLTSLKTRLHQLREQVMRDRQPRLGGTRLCWIRCVPALHPCTSSSFLLLLLPPPPPPPPPPPLPNPQAAPSTSCPCVRHTCWCPTRSSWTCCTARRCCTSAPSCSWSTPSSWRTRCRRPLGRS